MFTVNSKTIGIIIIGIVIIGIIIAFASNSNQDTMQDVSQIPQQQNTVNISDSATVIKTPSNNTNYIIDENGNKQYIIAVSDSPVVGD